MATIIVSIVCIALIVVGGMTLSQGILTSNDAAALSVDEFSVREGDIARTSLDIVSADELEWADLLRVTIANNGQTRLADFDKWDFIIHYTDSEGDVLTGWMPYSTGILTDNSWQAAKICLNGARECFEPGILNPGEELVMLARCTPLPAGNTTGEVTVAAPNGVYDTASLNNPGFTVLLPHADNISLSGTHYYELATTIPGDPTSVLLRTQFNNGETGRKILQTVGGNGHTASHLFPLLGIAEIPAAEWTVYYRCLTWGDGQFPANDGDVRFSLDILVRRADGSVSTVISSPAAAVDINTDDEGTWVTKSVTFTFPGYTVIDPDDYLEIDFYGETDHGPESGAGYMQLIIDDNTLPVLLRTRLEA
jgi:hypothetical protein